MSYLEPHLGNDIQSAFKSVFSVALEASHVIRSSAGKTFGVGGRLDSTLANGNYYIQALNYTALPADGAVNMLAAPIKIAHTSGTNDIWNFDFGIFGLWCSTGCVIALSSTEFTLTVGGSYLSMTALTPQNN